MGHKVHPRALRLAAGRLSFDHAWYSDRHYTQCLRGDLRLHRYWITLSGTYTLPQPRVSVHHGPEGSRVHVLLSVPTGGREHRARLFRIPSGLPTQGQGRRSQGQGPRGSMAALTSSRSGSPALTPWRQGSFLAQWEHVLSAWSGSPVACVPFVSGVEWQDAGFLADEIVYLLEHRISFRQIKNRMLRRWRAHPRVQGLRVVCAGRVGGKSKKAQRARRDHFHYGHTSLHVVDAPMDYAARTAHTPLGATGVKVWMSFTSRP